MVSQLTLKWHFPGATIVNDKVRLPNSDLTSVLSCIGGSERREGESAGVGSN